MADLLPRLRPTLGEIERLPADGFDATRFRSAGLVSDWHEARVGPAVAGRYRGRFWAVAEAGLDQLDERMAAARRRVRGRRFFGLLVAVELRADEGWPASCCCAGGAPSRPALRRWSPPVGGSTRRPSAGCWPGGTRPGATARRRPPAAARRGWRPLARLAEAVGEPAPLALTGTELLVALPRLLPSLRVEAKGDEAELAAAAERLRAALDVPRRLVDVLEEVGRRTPEARASPAPTSCHPPARPGVRCRDGRRVPARRPPDGPVEPGLTSRKLSPLVAPRLGAGP
jgi:hypothetical protein